MLHVTITQLLWHKHPESDMALQRLYESDRSFSGELDKLLHDEKYLGELLTLPEDQLIQLVNYLNDVSPSPPVK